MIKYRHTCLFVTDIEKSIKFYELFGFRPIRQETIQEDFVEKILEAPIKLTYVKLLGPQQDDNEIPLLEFHRVDEFIGTGHISFTVDDIEEEYKRLSEEGVIFLSAPLQSPYTNSKLCFCYDPDYNYIELVEDLK